MATSCLLVTSLSAACGDEGSRSSSALDGPEAGPARGYGPTEAASCPDVVFPLTLQAEDATLNGVETETVYGGHEGSAYVAGFEEIGDSVTFEFCVPEAGYYTVRLRYANGSGKLAYRTLFLDDRVVPGDHSFSSRWTWNDWEPSARTADFKDSFPLEAGRHTLKLSLEPNDTGAIALDSLTVTRGAEPSSTSITSMLLNDWDQLVAGVFASRLYAADDTDHPPRIGELRWRGNWEVNNLNQAAGYLRDEGAGFAYTEFSRHPMRTHLALNDGGVLEMSYLNSGNAPLPATVSKRHALPPGAGLMVVSYEVTNATEEARDFSMLEYVDLNRTGERVARDLIAEGQWPGEVSGQMRVEWREDLQAFIADMSELHGTYVVFGAFQAPAELSTGPAGGGAISTSSGGTGSSSSGGDDDESLNVSSLVSQFNDGPSLVRYDSFEGDDAEMGMIERVTLEAGATASFAYFYGVRGDLPSAEELARTARAQSPADWLEETESAWTEWLAQRKPLALDDPGLEQAYKTALLSIKHTQQPELGSFVAATNPAYQFKVWPRDASVVAMGLDASNYLDEAERYWLWMASVQETGENEEFPSGTWWTNYSYWVKDEGIPFVQPEWDSLGLFTIGVYRHYLLLQEQGDQAKADQFFAEIWPATRRASDFMANNIESNGFGPQDFSIWEDRFQYAMFTQATYASGLQAAYELGKVAGVTGEQEERLSSWLSAASSIKQAILRPYDQEACTGFWNPDEQYFIRGIDPDCAADARVDASTNLAWVFGLIDVDSERALQHRTMVLNTLSATDYYHGIARYEGDAFYYTEIYSPGGINESTVPETSWPQMSMYMSMAESWLGLSSLARDRLDWYVSVTGVGHMPPGEGADWATQQPLMGTAVEPVTGTWYLLALLVNAGQFEPRLTRVGPDSEL